jgi:hypothetical protein
MTLSYETSAVEATETLRDSIASSASVLPGNIVADVVSIESIRWQQKSFFAQNRFWVFFMNGSLEGGIYDTGTAYYSSSVDGITWNTATAIAANMTESSGENLQAILTSEGYVDVFARAIDHTHALFYMRGIPKGNGTITWLTSWQTAWQISQSNVDFYAIVDSDRYQWISWGYGAHLGSIYVYVTKNAYRNGTWQTASGFPKQVSPDSYMNDFMVPLSSGRVYVMYFNAPGLIYGKLWNGTAFGSEERASTSQVMPQFAYASESWSRSVAVDSGDSIYLLFLSVTQNLVFAQRNVSSGWSGETVVQSGAANYSSPSLNLIYDQSLQAYWVYNSTSIVFKDYLNGAWDADPTLIVNEQDEIPTIPGPGDDYDGRLNAFTQDFGSSFGLLWIANSSTSDMYHVKFGLVTLFEHDIGINNVVAAKNEIGLGYTANVTVLLANNGQHTETFNVILEANVTVIGSQHVSSLDAADHLTLVFTWNTSGLIYGDYTLNASADIVAGETFILNNNRACLIPVHVGVPGDVPTLIGPPDGRVDMRDIATVCSKFMTGPESSSWDAIMDINDDGVVNMRDIAIACNNFLAHE